MKEMIFFSAVDPAQATNRWNDFSSIVTWGVYRSAESRFGYMITVVDVFRERVETGALVDEMYAISEAWKPIAISIEAQTYESIVKYCLREEGRKRGFPIPWRTVTRGGMTSSAVRGKQRIRKIEPYLRNGTLRFVRHARGMDALVRELQDYPKGAHDDAIDALADFPEISFSPTAPASVRRWKELEPTVSNWEQTRRVYEQSGEDDVPYGIVVGRKS